jgi:uncharacterized membrane protein (UPF0136 family)
MTQRATALLVIFFGILTLVGGLMGYVSASSLPSLIAGSLAGTLLIISGIAMWKRSVLGYFAACALCVILLIFFGNRFWQTGKLMPPGLMTFASLGVFILLITSKSKK